MRQFHLVDAFTQSLSNSACGAQITIRQEHGELFPAESSDERLHFADCLDADSGKITQTLVTMQMATRVVEQLEAIHVNQQQCQ